MIFLNSKKKNAVTDDFGAHSLIIINCIFAINNY